MSWYNRSANKYCKIKEFQAMPHSSTVLSQILKLVPRHEFDKLTKQHDGSRRSDAFNRWTQFVALSVNHLAGRSSLRDIESTMDSQKHLRYHLGSHSVSRSALSRANQTLSPKFFESFFTTLYQRCAKGSAKHKFRFKRKLFSLDASLIDVSLKVFPNAEYNHMKGAYKLHVGLDHDGLIPAFAAITSGKTGDTQQARLMNFQKGSVLVFDKGYSSYEWHDSLTDRGIFFVTRIRSNAKYKVIKRQKVNKATGVTSDQIIQYTSIRASKYNLRPVRRVGYYDKETQKHYVFITNNLRWSAKTMAEIYKQRWQVELFFKWIKQNLKIKSFIGNSDNAVMTQVLVALCVYLILAYLKFQSKLNQSLQQIIRLIQVNIFVKRSLIELFKPPPRENIKTYQRELWVC